MGPKFFRSKTIFGPKMFFKKLNFFTTINFFWDIYFLIKTFVWTKNDIMKYDVMKYDFMKYFNPKNSYPGSKKPSFASLDQYFKSYSPKNDFVLFLQQMVHPKKGGAQPSKSFTIFIVKTQRNSTQSNSKATSLG